MLCDRGQTWQAPRRKLLGSTTGLLARPGIGRALIGAQGAGQDHHLPADSRATRKPTTGRSSWETPSPGLSTEPRRVDPEKTGGRRSPTGRSYPARRARVCVNALSRRLNFKG